MTDIDTLIAPEVEVPPMKALTAQDRCDRCGAQAYVVTKHEAGPLLWCKHHADMVEDQLLAQIVVDNRKDLLKRPTDAA